MQSKLPSRQSPCNKRKFENSEVRTSEFFISMDAYGERNESLAGGVHSVNAHRK